MTAPVTIVADPKWPNMHRLRFGDGTVSDMANLTRAKDALRLLEAEGGARPCNSTPTRSRSDPAVPIPQKPATLSSGPKQGSRVLRGQITGQSASCCDGIEAESPLGLCRKLIARGCDPATTLELFRADVLALRIAHIGVASKMLVANSGFAARKPDERQAALAQ